jgi:hypothetical protein
MTCPTTGTTRVNEEPTVAPALSCKYNGGVQRTPCQGFKRLRETCPLEAKGNFADRVRDRSRSCDK